MLKVAKFGGSSMADAKQFEKVRDIVRADPARKVIVVSAAGKRSADDHKLTDLLYLCYAHLQYGVSCDAVFQMICDRYIAIRDECGLNVDIEAELDVLRQQLRSGISEEELVSRGEYFSALLMADYLGYSFLDAELWVRFRFDGTIDKEASYAALQRLAEGRSVVIPGFYGVTPDGKIRTFSRGGSDITGALAAAALNADVYENWTDVAGVLAADPRLIQNPAPVGQLRYEELQTLSRVGMQILHEDAVAPVRQAQIPLRICNAFEPEKPGTLVRPQVEPDGGQICFAGRRKLAMLRLSCPQEPDAETKLADVLEQARLSPFSMQSVCGELTALVPMEPGSERLHRLREQAAQALRPQACTLRENLSVLAALCRSTAAVPELLRAVETSGAPVHLLQKCGACALLLVNDSQYEQSLRAAYAAWRRQCAGQHGCAHYYPDAYYAFTLENEGWLEDYALYMALKTANGMKSWTKWPREYRKREPQALEAFKAENEEEIGFWKFLQYEFSIQWKKLKAYANANNVQILGDIPIYVSADSVDAWVGGPLFELDADCLLYTSPSPRD